MRQALLRAPVWPACAVLGLLLALLAPGAGLAAPSVFDHYTTGFELLGQHREVACEGCHVGGIFKGTPQACFACHAAGSRIGASAKPARHIVSSNDCAQCHTPFAWKPVAQFNHLNVLGTCSSCHNNVQAIGKPSRHIPTTAECGSCHPVMKPWTAGLNIPSNHIPYATTANCSDCHKNADFSVTPSLTDIHKFAPSTTANCIQCHGSAAATFSIASNGFAIKAIPAKHVTSNANAACEGCHVGAISSIKTLPVTDGSTFAGSAMNHAGVTDCAGCHGPDTTGFTGVAQLVIMPPTAPVGPNSHIPSTAACADCHVAPTGLIAASAASLAIGSTGFLTPLPSTTQIHSGITGNCASCHEGNNVWADMAKYPLAPAALTGNATTPYMGFQTRPLAVASGFSIADPAHPTAGDCSTCHTRTDYFEGAVKPSNHIPYAATATCGACHTNPDFSVRPALTDIHANAQSTTANCIQCHGSAAASFAIPAANNFAIVGIPPKHVSSNADAACESCHVGANSSIKVLPVVNGAKFSGSAMSHAGLTTCVSCHGAGVGGFTGIAQLVVMPPTAPTGPNAHIPSVTTCEGCHAAPAGLIVASAPTLAIGATGFLTPLPTTAQIHSGIISNCASCHEGNNVWADMGKYPLAPAALTGVPTSPYKGFQTRPLAAASNFSIADAAHPKSGDCSQCHASTDYFDGVVKPANHIPYAAPATCSSCHKSADFSVWPSLTDIHANAPSTTSNCIQCHGSTAASFAIPAANNFAVVGIPARHISSNANAACETCHVGANSSIKTLPVVNGAKFSGSAMSHAGLTTCVSCHGPGTGGFTGVSQLVVMPPTSPASASTHIPSATSCEGCHAAPAGLVALPTALPALGATGFLAPIPATGQIHAGVTSGCAACHENGSVWLDMAKYPIAPAALTGNAASQYTGMQLRPRAAASTFSVADAAHPASGDCVTCHGTNFNYFSGQAEPANHIPTTTNTCSVCHTTAGNYAVWSGNLTTLHANVPTTCSTCHTDGKGPFAGAPGFRIVQMSTPGRHIPITNGGIPVECSGCHKSVTTFSGTIMRHSAIGDSGSSAAGNACDACHELRFDTIFYGMQIQWLRNDAQHYICGAPGTPTAPNITVCGGGGSDCLTGCHQHQNSIPAKFASVRPKTPQKQIQGAVPPVVPRIAPPVSVTTPRRGIGLPGVGTTVRATTSGRVDHASLAGRSCLSCHDGRNAAGKGPLHPSTTAACGDCHSTLAWQPVLRIDHADVVGACYSCHNGRLARAKPAGHPLAGNDCDRCHTTSAWKPAAFDHATVTSGTCATCHNALVAPGKPPAHVATALSCDSCHYVLGWKPVKTPRVQPPAPPKAAPRTPTIPRTRGSALPASPP